MRMLVVASSIRELEGLECPCTRVIGVGKAHAALYTTLAIEEVWPDLVVCVGYARALQSGLSIGDLVTASSVWQHDVDISSFGCKPGELPGPDGKMEGELALHPVPGVACGVCASGDVFVTRPYQESHPTLNSSLFCDMESYGVALAAKAKGVPCALLRAISDDSCGHRPKKFSSFVREANKQISQTLLRIS